MTASGPARKFVGVFRNPMVAPEGRLCRPDHLTATGGCVGGGREGGLPPSRYAVRYGG